MLAKISKTFKGSLGNLISDSNESENNFGHIREYCGSVVSESTDYSVGRRKEKRKSKRFSKMFSSDVEEDDKSNVPAKPKSNMRSVSMVSLLSVYNSFLIPIFSAFPCHGSLQEKNS